MARRSPHIASHDLHEVEGHTEKDVTPKKDMYEFGRTEDALDFEKQQIILLIVHRELYNFLTLI